MEEKGQSNCIKNYQSKIRYLETLHSGHSSLSHSVDRNSEDSLLAVVSVLCTATVFLCHL